MLLSIDGNTSAFYLSTNFMCWKDIMGTCEANIYLWLQLPFLLLPKYLEISKFTSDMAFLETWRPK